jgi:hypothetical protein
MKGISSQLNTLITKYSLFKIFTSFDINYPILGNFFLFINYTCQNLNFWKMIFP